MTLDEKWEMIRLYYQTHYYDPEKPKLRFRFRGRPSDENIEALFLEMKKLGRSLSEFYQENQGLYSKLQQLRGMVEDPIKKRKASD